MKKKLLTLVGACLLGGLGAGCNDRGPEAAAPPPPPPAPAAAPAPAPAPVADASADTDAPPPPVVEEGATYEGQAVVALDPATVDWVFVGGGWHYWNPRFHVWVHSVRPSDWHPPGHAVTIRSWGERPLEHRDPDGRTFRETVVKRAAPRPDVRKPEERREEHRE